MSVRHLQALSASLPVHRECDGRGRGYSRKSDPGQACVGALAVRCDPAMSSPGANAPTRHRRRDAAMR
jgi:hypothetical protein